MNRPRTRVVEGKTDFERGLLRAWGSEKPTNDARRRAMALTGIGAAVSGSTTTAAASGGGAATHVAGSKAAATGLVALGKWVAAGAVGAVVAAGVMRTVSRTSTSIATSTSTSIATSTSTSIATSTPIAIATSTPIAIATPAATAIASVAPTPIAKPTLPALGLGDQVAALDRARTALAAGDTTTTLQRLDDYGARFPHGMLAQEATVLRIEALLQRGDRVGAAALGARFLAANPASPHTAKLRRLLAGVANP